MSKPIRIEGDEIFFEVVRTESVRMSQPIRDFIRDAANRDTSLKIQAIKFVHAEYNISLADAKNIVDGLTANPASNLGQLLREKLDRAA